MNITNIIFAELDTPDYNSRLSDIKVVMTVTGTPPYSVSQNNIGLVIGNQFGPDVYITISRDTFPRDITVADDTNASITFEADTLQPINTNADYSTYTLATTTSGPSTATLSQTLYNTGTYDQYANRLIRVVDPETSYPLSEWVSITIDGSYDYLGLPLRYVNIEIKDEYNSSYKLYRAIDTPAPADELTIIQDIDPISLIGDLQSVVVSGKANYVDTFKLTYDGLKVETYPDKNSGYGVFSINELVPQFNEDYTVYENRDLFHNPKHNIITNSLDQISSGYYTVEDAFGTIDSDLKYFIAGATIYGDNFNINDYTCNPISSAPIDQKFLSNWKGNYLLRHTDYAVTKFLNGDFINGYTGTPGININNTHIAFVIYEKGEEKHTYIDDDPWFYDEYRTNYIALADGGMDAYLNQKQSVPYGIQNYTDAMVGGNVTDDGGTIMTDNILTDEDTVMYEVFLVKIDDIITKGSQSLYIDINTDCSRFNLTQIFFEDSLGCYNTFTFDNINVKEYTIKRTTSASNVNSLNRTNGNYGYNVGDRGRKTNMVQRSEEHQVISGWIDDHISSNLMDLYTSADVFVIIDGERYPILISGESVEEKNYKNNRLFNHTISFIMAYDINSNV